MSSESVYRQLRLAALAVGTTVLTLEAGLHYRRAVLPSALQAELTEASRTVPQALIPDQTPAATLTPLSRLVRFSEVLTVNADQITAAQQSFLGYTSPPRVSSLVVYQLDYEIQNQRGQWVPISAEVVMPQSTGSYPLYVFGSGTTGIADSCAPSRENVAVDNMGNYHHHMIAQAAEGYVTIFPDYEGFNNPDATQAYFIVESEAKVLLGAVERLVELQASNAAARVADPTQVFLAGYSQGGHAALSAAQQWSRLPPGSRLSGVVQFAGAADIKALFRESPWLASYLVASYSEYYQPELQPSLVLQDRWLQALPSNNAQLCVNQAYRFYPKPGDQLYTAAFLEALQSDTWPDSLFRWQAAMELNTPLYDLPPVPYLSVQGAVDPIVTAHTQVANVAVMCQQGLQVRYEEYAGVNHFRVRQAGFALSNAWMRDVLNGLPSTTNCP